MEHEHLRLLHIAQAVDVVKRQFLIDLLGRHDKEGQEAEFANVVGIERGGQAHGVREIGGHFDQTEGFDTEVDAIVHTTLAHSVAEHAVHGGTQQALDVAHLGIEVGSGSHKKEKKGVL